MRLTSVFLLLFVGWSVAFVGCENKKSSKILRTNFVHYSSGDSLDPAYLEFAQQYFVLDNMTIKLVGIGDQDQYVNELAKSIEFSEDKKTVKIEIKDARFSDGTQILAKDVAMSLKRAALLGSPHTNIEDLWLGSAKLQSIDDQIPGIKVQSKTKLTLRLTREAKEILYFLSMADLGVLHPNQYKKKKLLVDDWTKVTSGPFSGELDKSSNIKLVANKHYIFKNPDHPREVHFNDQHGDKLSPAVKSGTIDIGFVSFNDYLKNEKLITSRGYTVLGEQYDALAFIVLNAKSKKYSKPEVRRAFLKNIFDNFELGAQTKVAAKKATQFFLPDAMGYVDDEKVRKKIESLSSVSGDLKSVLGGQVKIDGIEGMKDYLPKDLEDRLSSALGGLDVSVKLETPNKANKQKFKVDRDFEAYIIAVGMSKKVLGEALNLQYLTDPPYLLDPAGKVKRLLKAYQGREKVSEESDIISQIILQMIEDAELIPLFYFSAPFILNTKTVGSTKLNLRESIKFSKVRMK